MPKDYLHKIHENKPPEDKIIRKRLPVKETLDEILKLFKSYKINLVRFNIIGSGKKILLPVHWDDKRSENGKTVINSGNIVYSFSSYHDADEVRNKVLAAEPQIGDKIRITVSEDRLSFGTLPGISMKGVEAIVNKNREAIPTKEGIELLLRRAKEAPFFDKNWIVQMEKDAKNEEFVRLSRVPAEGYMCEIVEKPKANLEHMASLIILERPSCKTSAENLMIYGRALRVLKENINKLD